MRATTSDERRPGVRALAGLALAVTVAACADDPNGPAGIDPELALSAGDGGAYGWDLPLTAADQLQRAFPGRACDAPEHHAFDFWVGDWNVTNTGGTHIGTNSVTSELDGCLVFEHWTGGSGARGWSLNAYDPETGLWNQTWVSQVPGGVYARLRTTGGLVDGVMSLEGVRHATAGFTFLDSWTWSENDAGQVIQSANAVIPELGLQFPFTGVYTRGAITPAPPLSLGLCAAGAVGGETRMGDFLIGTWTVAVAGGQAVGRSTIETALDDCLFVERLETDGGLSAVAFIYFDRWTQLWYRTYVDSEGERLELSGTIQEGALVLTGTEETSSGPVDVRLSWRPEAGRIVQTWEQSGDGGTTWRSTATVRYAGGSGEADLLTTHADPAASGSGEGRRPLGPEALSAAGARMR